MLSGDVSKGLAPTVFEANRLLKIAKLNSDIGLSFAPLGPLADCRIVRAFDASFCSRSDGSSQGGFMVLLVPKKVLETDEGVPYRDRDVSNFLVWHAVPSQLKPELLAAQATQPTLLAGTMNISYDLG